MMIAGVLQGAMTAPDSPVADRTVEELVAELGGHSAIDQVVDAMIRTGAYGDWFGAVPDGLSLAKLEANPHGIDLGPLQPRLPGVLRTPSGKIELAPELIIDDLDPPRGVARPSTATATSCWSVAATCARTTRGCTT